MAETKHPEAGRLRISCGSGLSNGLVAEVADGAGGWTRVRGLTAVSWEAPGKDTFTKAVLHIEAPLVDLQARGENVTLQARGRAPDHSISEAYDRDLLKACAQGFGVPLPAAQGFVGTRREPQQQASAALRRDADPTRALMRRVQRAASLFDETVLVLHRDGATATDCRLQFGSAAHYAAFTTYLPERAFSAVLLWDLPEHDADVAAVSAILQTRMHPKGMVAAHDSKGSWLLLREAMSIVGSDIRHQMASGLSPLFAFGALAEQVDAAQQRCGRAPAALHSGGEVPWKTISAIRSDGVTILGVDYGIQREMWIPDPIPCSSRIRLRDVMQQCGSIRAAELPLASVPLASMAAETLVPNTCQEPFPERVGFGEPDPPAPQAEPPPTAKPFDDALTRALQKHRGL